ncbi:MAG: hypothetical protein HPY69_09565 [Armatimonadetes bacterium]|nr:hypothetical protein [Armatimonadota bacterium]
MSSHRPLLIIGMLLSALVALGANYELIFDPAAREKWADSPDSVAITKEGLAADAGKVASWWYGPWIEGEMYYRPLSSMFMWLEARLFGWNFLPYNLISWFIQAGIAALVFLLLFRVCPGPEWQRALSGLVAAGCFVGGHHPPGPDGLWIRARVTWGVMPWWPVQTDICSLFMSLLSLILLDRWLVADGRGQGTAPADGEEVEGAGRIGFGSRLPTGALVCFLAAILFKETPLTLIFMVPLFGLYRGRPWLRYTLAYAALGVLLLVIRAIAVPGASNPEWLGGATFYKYLLFVHLETANLLVAGEIWHWVTVITLIPLVLLLRRTKLDPLYIVLICLVWPLVCAGVVAGNPMLATVGRDLGILGRLLLVYAGFALALLTWPRQPALLFVTCLFIVALPNINRIGPHYWYWPVAFWGLADGAVLSAAVSALRDWRQCRVRRVTSVPEPVEAPTP